MATNRKRDTFALNNEWRKEIKRLKQFINRSTKRGFTYPSDIIPEKPEKVTESYIERLRSLTPQSLYKKGKYTDPATGAKMTGTQGRALERSRASKKAAKTVAQRAGRISPLSVTKSVASNRLPRKRIATSESKQRKRINALISRVTKRGFTVDTESLFNHYGIDATSTAEQLKQINGKTIYEFATYTDPITGEIMSGVAGRTTERSRAALKAAKTRKLSAVPEEMISPELRSARERFSSDYAELEDIDKVSSPIDYSIIENVKEEIARWSPSVLWSDSMQEWKASDKETLARILNGAIQVDGYDTVAKRLQDNAMEVNQLIEAILYKSSGGSTQKFDNGREDVNFDLVRFSSIVSGRILTPDESARLTDAVESLEVNN